MSSDSSLSQVRGIWSGWPITHRLEDWRVTLDWMAELGFNTLLYPAYYEWNALVHLQSLPEMMAKNVVRATYWSASRGENVQFDGPPPMSAPGAFPDLLAESADRGIEVLPLVTCFGHNFLLVAAYPEIRAQGCEDPCAVPCTSNPRTYELLFTVFGDLLDQYKSPPRFAHVAMDEQWQICQCPACAKKGPVQIYIDHVSRIHAFFAARGIRTIVFDDMLRSLRGRPRLYFDSDEQIAQILDEMPKDIVMQLWHYSTPVEAEEMADWVAWFAQRGFQICLCPGHNIARAHLLFDATPNALTMLEYGLKAAQATSANQTPGVISYSPHLFPQEPFYHALAHKVKTGEDDGAQRFLRALLGDRADPVRDALATITECALQARQGRDLQGEIERFKDASADQRTVMRNAATRMAQAASRALSHLEDVAQPSPAVARLTAGFHLARTVSSRQNMAHALVEGKRKILAHLHARDFASADRELATMRAALVEGLDHIETALRVLEPVLDWDRNVHRVLCLLTVERTFVQDQLRTLDWTQQHLDGALHQRPSLLWLPG
jgi:hypothetical protein